MLMRRNKHYREWPELTRNVLGIHMIGAESTGYHGLRPEREPLWMKVVGLLAIALSVVVLLALITSNA